MDDHVKNALAYISVQKQKPELDLDDIFETGISSRIAPKHVSSGGTGSRQLPKKHKKEMKDLVRSRDVVIAPQQEEKRKEGERTKVKTPQTGRTLISRVAKFMSPKKRVKMKSPKKITPKRQKSPKPQSPKTGRSLISRVAKFMSPKKSPKKKLKEEESKPETPDMTPFTKKQMKRRSRTRPRMRSRFSKENPDPQFSVSSLKHSTPMHEIDKPIPIRFDDDDTTVSNRPPYFIHNEDRHIQSLPADQYPFPAQYQSVFGSHHPYTKLGFSTELQEKITPEEIGSLRKSSDVIFKGLEELQKRRREKHPLNKLTEFATDFLLMSNLDILHNITPLKQLNEAHDKLGLELLGGEHPDYKTKIPSATSFV